MNNFILRGLSAFSNPLIAQGTALARGLGHMNLANTGDKANIIGSSLAALIAGGAAGGLFGGTAAAGGAGGMAGTGGTASGGLGGLLGGGGWLSLGSLLGGGGGGGGVGAPTQDMSPPVDFHPEQYGSPSFPDNLSGLLALLNMQKNNIPNDTHPFLGGSGTI